MSKSFEVRIPTPPPFHNKGNLVFSLSQLGRHMAEQAEELGAMVLPETDAQRLLVADGAVRGVKTGDKGLGREGEPLGSYEPGVEVHAQATVLAEGTQGHLAGAAIEHFGLQGRVPADLEPGRQGGVAGGEAARPRHPHAGLAVPDDAARIARSAAPSSTRWATDMVAIGFVLGLDYRDATLSVHDSLQEFKTHPMVRRLLEGGERIGWGAKTIPEGGFLALPSSLSMPGAVLTGDSAGFVNVPKLKGVHYAMRSGMLAAEAIYEQLKAGAGSGGAGRAGGVRPAGAVEPHLERPAAGAEHAPGAGQGALRWAADRRADGHHPRRAAAGQLAVPPRRGGGGRADPGKRVYPAPDGKLTFDKLSSVFLSGNRSRDDQPNHLRIQRRVPREVAEAWVAMCPAAVYEIGRTTAGRPSQLKLTPSNCVQCGAITAKGGRLTPPEGGSGPEYIEHVATRAVPGRRVGRCREVQHRCQAQVLRCRGVTRP